MKNPKDRKIVLFLTGEITKEKKMIKKLLFITAVLLFGLANIVGAFNLEKLQKVTITISEFPEQENFFGGVFITENTILTVCHGVRKARVMCIHFAEDRKEIGIVIKRSKELDLALIVTPGIHSYAELNLHPKLGQEICAIGNPFGMKDIITFGRICKITPEWIVTDNKQTFGFSGGGVFDDENRLVALVSQGRGYKLADWLNFSISPNLIQAFIGNVAKYDLPRALPLPWGEK